MRCRLAIEEYGPELIYIKGKTSMDHFWFHGMIQFQNFGDHHRRNVRIIFDPFRMKNVEAIDATEENTAITGRKSRARIKLHVLKPTRCIIILNLLLL